MVGSISGKAGLLTLVVALAAALNLSSDSATLAATGDACPTAFSQFTLPHENSNPAQMAKGFNDDVWFSENSSNPLRIGRINSAGVVSEYNIPGVDRAQINDIARGPDDAMWFTLLGFGNGKIGRIDQVGSVNLFDLGQGSYPVKIVSAPDGALWFTKTGPNQATDRAIVRMTTDGSTTTYSLANSGLPNDAGAVGMTVGPDGALWFPYEGSSVGTAGTAEGIGRITLTGEMSFFPMPLIYRSLENIITGPDGALWFNEYAQGVQSIGRMTTDGQLTEYPVGQDFHPYGLTNGPDGTVWFSTSEGAVGRITPQPFKIDYFYPPNNDPGAGEIVHGADGALWTTEPGFNKIARIQPPVGLIVEAPTNVTGASPVATPSLTWNASPGAAQYIVCRDGVQVAQAATNSFSDTAALSDGPHDYSVVAVDANGQQSGSSRLFTVIVDTTPATVSDIAWSANPLLQGQTTTLSVAVTYEASSVSYSIDGSPHQGMQFNSETGRWTSTFGSELNVSTYNVDILVSDISGMQSTSSDVLAVYNPANGYVTGHSKITPDSDDVLPIDWDTSAHPAEVVIGLTNIRVAANQPVSGSFDARYIVKNNKDEFELSSSTIDWMVVTDSAHATIQGKATLSVYKNGQLTTHPNVTVRIEVAMLANGDQVTMKIYDTGVVSTGQPTWIVSGVASGQDSRLMIK